MFNVSAKSIKPCNKVMRISELFHLQVFLYQTFLYAVFQSSIRGALRTSSPEIELLQR